MHRTRAVFALGAALLSALGSAPAGAAPSGGDPDRIAAQIVAVQHQADQAATTVARLDQQYEALTEEVDRLHGEQAKLQDRLHALSQSLRGVALNRYVSATSGLTSGIGLSLGDPNDAAVSQYLVELSTGGGNQQIDEYRATADDMAQTQAALQDRQASAERQQKAVAASRSSLERRLDDLRASQAKAQADKAVQAALARRRQADAAKAAASAAAAQAQAQTLNATAGQGAAVPAATAVAGDGWLCPVVGTTAFGDTYGGIHQGIRHIGVDMMGHLDQEIVAVVSGTVRPTQSGLGGNQVWLYGDDGNKYFYAHLNRYGASGQVAAGQVVGYMGSTGRTGAVHLHFEIHPGGGAAINPTPTVRAHC